MKYLRKITAANISPEYANRVDSMMIYTIRNSLNKLQHVKLNNQEDLHNEIEDAMIAVEDIDNAMADLASRKGYLDYNVTMKVFKNKITKIEHILKKEVMFQDINQYKELVEDAKRFFDNEVINRILGIDRSERN